MISKNTKSITPLSIPNSPTKPSFSATKISDQKLYELCTHYGKMARIYRRKFIGLLPEVNRRRLYAEKGFLSIFEFAAKLAGLSKEQVARVLQLERKFENKPVLKKILIEGKESINKLARVASIATPENQEFLARQIKVLPKKAVETLVRDIKNSAQNNSNFSSGGLVDFSTPNGLFEPNRDHNSVLGHGISDLKLSAEVVAKLTEIQNKGIDINELILEFLQKRELEIACEKEEISRQNRTPQSLQIPVSKPAPRYIPVKIKKILQKEHGSKCSIPHCQKSAKIIHHTARFTLSQEHNPYFLAPLCREHHLIAHSIDVAFLKKRANVS